MKSLLHTVFRQPDGKLLFVGHVTVGSRHVHYGMIATGNHNDFDSLRGAPPRPQPIDEYAEPLFTLPRISAKTYHSVFVTGSVEACLDPTKSVLEKDDTRNVLMKTVRMLDTHEEIIGLSGHLLAVSKKDDRHAVMTSE